MSRDTKIKDITIVRSDYEPENYEKEKQGLARIGTEGCIPKNRDYIALYADEPCLEACKKLYDLNIQTYTSNGHVNGKENAEGRAYIGIIYDTLSDENKLIVNDLINKKIIRPVAESIKERGTGRHISIEVPIHSDDLVGEISDKLLAMANVFQQQDVLYGRYTYEEMINRFFPLLDNNMHSDVFTFEEINEEAVHARIKEYQDEGFIPAFSEDGELFFETEDLLNKHISFLNMNSNYIK